MKQQIISGLKKKLLLVELPKYLKEFTLGGKTVMDFGDGIKSNKCYGKLTDIKEEQFSQLIDKFNNGAYKNYNDKNLFYPDADINNILLTAKESFLSKLEADEIYFENKIQKPTIKESTGTVDLSLRLSAYYESQEKVWDINGAYLFLIS